MSAAEMVGLIFASVVVRQTLVMPIRVGMSDGGSEMDEDYEEQAELERRIGESGWHIVRDDQVGDGYTVEFQRAPTAEFVPGAETRTTTGADRNEAYRRFLEEIAADNAADA